MQKFEAEPPWNSCKVLLTCNWYWHLLLYLLLILLPQNNNQVRNEPAEDFLNLIKSWAKLCEEFALLGSERLDSDPDMDEDENEAVRKEESGNQSDSEEFEVEKLLAVCYGDPNDVKKPGLYFKACFLQAS